MKAKIVIDMPDYCDCCPCMDESGNDDYYRCMLAWYIETDDNTPRNKYSFEDSFQKRPDWCPLEPIVEQDIAYNQSNLEKCYVLKPMTSSKVDPSVISLEELDKCLRCVDPNDTGWEK